ncbi:MAG: TIGR01244 family phosphatase [Alphaproteobacteria bacterium]|nr:TIGR01244 family phosphatase [Alphaproteobacteria bacterium]
MQINRVTPDYSVAGQISVADVADIARAGFKSLICNRPDSEIEASLHAEIIKAEAARHDMIFTYNPISNQGMTMQNLTAQADVIAKTDGPVFAYCRSGTRSTICWAFLMAGKMPVQDIVSLAIAAGYNLEKQQPQLEAMAAQP